MSAPSAARTSPTIAIGQDATPVKARTLSALFDAVSPFRDCPPFSVRDGAVVVVLVVGVVVVVVVVVTSTGDTVSVAWASLLVDDVDVSVDVTGTAKRFVSVQSPEAGDTYATLCNEPVTPTSTVAVTEITAPSAPDANPADAVHVTPAHAYPVPDIDTSVNPAGNTSVTDQPAAASAGPLL